MERVMRVMQWLATAMLVLAAVMLLVKPLTAHAQAAGGRAPARVGMDASSR